MYVYEELSGFKSQIMAKKHNKNNPFKCTYQAIQQNTAQKQLLNIFIRSLFYLNQLYQLIHLCLIKSFLKQKYNRSNKMKKNYISDLRYCQKIKESQTFMSIDGLQKKVRKKYTYKPTIQYDAQKKQRQIMCFWKEGWQYEHFHPVFLNPKVFYPIVMMMDPQIQDHSEIKKYAQTIKKLIERLRTDQEVQVNYKVDEREYINDWTKLDQFSKKFKYMAVADKSTAHLFKCLLRTTKAMVDSAQQSHQQFSQQIQDSSIISDDLIKISDIKSQLMYVQKVLQNHSQRTTMMEQQDNQVYKEQTSNLKSFIANVIQVLDEMKKQQHGPSFISVQPKIGNLTYIVHPILCAVNALFMKQKVQRERIKKIARQFQEKISQIESQPKQSKLAQKILYQKQQKQKKVWQSEFFDINQTYLLEVKDNFKQQDQTHSKIVFINLDGYESEYNLQLARNFHKNLMYISFPKFTTAQKDKTSIYEQRFYKKIMFQKTKLSDCDTDNLQLKAYFRQQKIMKNPEQYHQNIEKLYKENQSQQFNEQYVKAIDKNQKMYIFPMSMNTFLSNHSEQFPQYYQNFQSQKDQIHNRGQKSRGQSFYKQNIQPSESYFIRFIFRRYLNSQIQKFKPTHIIISYSNRIVLEDSHFVEMLQQLTKLSANKVMMFPNFTTSYLNQIKMETSQKQTPMKQSQQEQYCYTVSNARLLISDNRPLYEQDQDAFCIDNCPLTMSFYSKVLRFLKITSGTYNLQQNYQNQSLNAKLQNIKVYPYIDFLFKAMSQQYSHLANKIDKDMLRADKFFIQQRLKQQNQDLRKCLPIFYKSLLNKIQSLLCTQKPSPYIEDIQRVLETITHEYNKKRLHNIRKVNQEVIKTAFSQFRTLQEKQRIDNKFQQKIHIYFKTKSQITQYEGACQQKLNIKSNSGLHIVTFSLNKQINLQIYKDTSILFQTNQQAKKQAFVLIMNHLSLNSNHVNNYIGRVKVNTTSSFQQQTCFVEPIQFFDNQGLIPSEPFKAKCEWNFKETNQYLILFWPSDYDFVKATLFKMMKHQYEPRILDEIFVADKTIENKSYNKFYKIRILLDVPINPRRGCSIYEFQYKLFIFGGFYQREFNYLQQQNDIVTIDLELFDLMMRPQMTLRNIKNHLFSKDLFQEIVRQESSIRKINSFIRPKIQIQFYDCQDICTADLLPYFNNETTKSVIMIGGYGQNFLFPHSLLTYFYHIIRFDRATRTIRSIEKKNVNDKPIPINLKEFIKNKHIFQNFNICQNDNISKGYTKQSHYFFHRVAFCLSKENKQNKNNENNNVELFDLNYKFLFMYAAQMFNQVDKNYLKFAQKIGQKRIIQETQGAKVEIINGCNNNLLITNEQGSYMYCLNFKSGISKIAIALTNQSILSLDSNNNMVCGLIKHKQHTLDKCVLAAQKIQMPNPKLAYLNQTHFVDLIQFVQLEDNYQMHVLFMMKRNELLLVHGNCFEECQISDKLITTKYSKAQTFGQIIKQKSPSIKSPVISSKIFYDCTSFFMRINQRVMVINFMSHRQKTLEFVYGFDKNSLELNSPKKEWKGENVISYHSFYITMNKEQIFLGKIKFLEVVKKSNVENYCLISAFVPMDKTGLKKFYFVIEKLHCEQVPLKFKNMNILKVKVQPLTQNEKWMNVSWKKMYKNEQRYVDCMIPLNKNH